MDDEQKAIREKIADWRRFSMVCLFLGTFLYAGTLIEKYREAGDKSLILFAASFLFIIISLFFYWRSVRLDQKISE